MPHGRDLPRHASRAALAALVALALTGCGPVGYVQTVTRRASTAVEEARAVNAVKYAPYWWTRAVEYLHKAREEAAHADFRAANRFGRLAAAAAEQARADAVRRAADPKLMEEITPPPGVRDRTRGKGGLAPVDDGGAAPDDGGGLAPLDDGADPAGDDEAPP